MDFSMDYEIDLDAWDLGETYKLQLWVISESRMSLFIHIDYRLIQGWAKRDLFHKFLEISP